MRRVLARVPAMRKRDLAADAAFDAAKKTGALRRPLDNTCCQHSRRIAWNAFEPI